MPPRPRALPAACVERLRAADAILHAGDFMRLEVLEMLEALGPPVHAVHGNVDTASCGAAARPRAWSRPTARGSR